MKKIILGTFIIVITVIVVAFNIKPSIKAQTGPELSLNYLKEKGAEVYYVELQADYDIRIDRNKTENRLLNKPTKRDIEFSEKLFIYLEDNYRLNSNEGEIQEKNHLRINNTLVSPEEVAKTLKNEFSL